MLVAVVAAAPPAAAQDFGDVFNPGGTAAGQAFTESAEAVEVSVVPAHTRVAPGDTLPVAIIFDHAEGYHVHPNKPKVPAGSDFEPIATAVSVKLPDGSPLTAYPNLIDWPDEHEIEVAFFGPEPVMYGVYEGKAVAYLPVTVAEDAKPSETTFTVDLTIQACNDVTCLAPSDTSRSVTLTIMSPAALAEAGGRGEIDSELFAGFPTDIWARIKAGDTGPSLIDFDLFGWQFAIDASAGGGFAMLLLVAALGGFLLNLTPCVLPVIPLKIMGLSQSASNRAKCLALGVSMSIGVVAFWLALGGVIAGFAEFTSTNQLFQYPAFTITVGVIIAVMAIGMCGLFSVRLPQWVYMINPRHDSLGGSFGFGVMTAILSTPCTAPFMGAAAAWAAGQHPATTLSTFAAIGAGMALPYLILSAYPALVDRMPRTGPASELIKQVMGLLMLAAAAYFAGSGVSGLLKEPADPPNKMYWWVVMGFVIAAGGWLIWRTIHITPSTLRRVTFGAIGVFFIASGTLAGAALTAKGPIAWEYYNPQRFEQRVAEGKIILMDFTAEWCANCKTLEHTVLYTDRIVALTKQPDIVPMQVDLTGNNPAGNAKLVDTGRRTIPLLAIFGPDGKLRWMSDFYTVQNIVDAVEEVRGSGGTKQAAEQAVEQVSPPPPSH